MPPRPLVTRSVTSDAEGFAASRLGPTVPLAPASASVWQPPHPASAKTLLAERDGGGVGGCRRGLVASLHDDGDGDERRRSGDGHPPVRHARVAEVVEEPYPRADRHEADEHEPRVVGAVREREVPGEHRQENRQREVVVVDRALLRLDARPWIRLAARLLGTDQLPVGRDDDEEDVRRHHRPDHRADLEPRRPRAEELRRPPRRERDEHDEHGPQHARVGDEPVEARRRRSTRRRAARSRS